MMERRTLMVVALATIIALGCGAVVLSGAAAQQSVGASPPDEPDDHDHGAADAEGAPAEVDDHAGHDHGADESVVQLSSAERTKYGVIVATASHGNLATRIRLPGEIVLNADRVAHIVPRAPGIVREVVAGIGDSVRGGEVMAWLESVELGDAKVDYLAKWSELGCCTLDLARAQAVHDNTLGLLELLDTSPSLETLRETKGGEMGENRSLLVSAYAELIFAEAAYLRERPLYEKKVSSERDFQAAEAEYKKADALYAATRDSISFKVRRELLEARRLRQMRDIELRGARRRLFVLGLTADGISEMEAAAWFHQGGSDPGPEPPCSDPNCKDCDSKETTSGGRMAAGTPESEERLAWYPLRAPFDATVIEKHLTLGEKHGDEAGAFTVADLGTVWVNIAVYQKDLAYVREGMDATISVGADMRSVLGTIAYVAPVVDQKTRTAMARVVLPNPDGELRPGLFVNAEIAMGHKVAAVVIAKSAVQRMDEEAVVFLETAEGFRPVPVTLGRSNESSVEVRSGLTVGQRYVTQGAFELKAKIVTSGLDPHAGHGH